jgi:hypothetical protein
VANDAATRAQAGEDLATIALEVDPSANPDLGCLGETGSPELDAALAAIAVDEVGDPITLPADVGTGFLVARVDSRGALTEEQATEQLVAQAEQQAAQQDPLGPVIEAAFEDAEIRVASRYGTWDDELRAVVPPEGPAPNPDATTTTIPAIDPATGLPAQGAPAEEAPAEGG